MDVGPEKRPKTAFGKDNGYRQKTQVIQFSYSEASPKEKISELKGGNMRARAKAAHKFLKRSSVSCYGEFLKMRKKFFERQPEADERQCRRLPSFIEQVGTECAVWPHLNWRTTMRESHAAQHEEELYGQGLVTTTWVRFYLRPGAIRLRPQLVERSWREEEFAIRCTASPADERPLSAFGQFGKDLMCQVGTPRLFWTISPCEYRMNYHEWVRDEMSKSLRTRLHLRAAEALHMAQTLSQIVDGILAGSNMQKAQASRAWSKHILSAKDESEEHLKLIVFTRLEFQDVTHKEGAFRYVGSRSRKAWSGYEPTAEELQELFQKHLSTTILTCTKLKERVINDLSVQTVFGNWKPLATIRPDLEQDPENYDAEGKWRSDRRPRAHMILVYKKMMLVLTQNGRKDIDFVNGMQCEVEHFEENELGGVLRVRLETGRRLPVTIWTDVHKQEVRYFRCVVGTAAQFIWRKEENTST